MFAYTPSLLIEFICMISFLTVFWHLRSNRSTLIRFGISISQRSIQHMCDCGIFLVFRGVGLVCITHGMRHGFFRDTTNCETN